MEFLLVHKGEYKLYYSLRRLCKENGLDPAKIDRDRLPTQTPAGYIIGVVPDTRI